jgi:hypothetical protein
MQSDDQGAGLGTGHTGDEWTEIVIHVARFLMITLRPAFNTLPTQE